MTDLYETSGTSPPTEQSTTSNQATAPAFDKGAQQQTCKHPETRPVLGGRLCLVCGKFIEGGRR